MSSGGGGNTTTVQKSEPWKGLQPYLKDLYQQAQTQYNQGPQQYYPGSTVAQTSPWTNQALNTMAGYGGSGVNQSILANNNATMAALQQAMNSAQNPVFQAGQQLSPGSIDTLQKLTSGQGVNVNNPALEAQVKAAQQRTMDAFNTGVMPQINLNAVGTGNFGSTRQGIAQGLAAKGLAQSLGDVSANMYGNAYENTQNRALQGSTAGLGQLNQGLATTMQGAQLTGALTPMWQQTPMYGTNLQLQAGQAQQGLSQQQLDDMVARWNFQQQAPWQNMQNYAGLLGSQGSVGGTTSTTGAGQSGSPLMGGIGGALSGAGLYGALTSGATPLLTASGPLGWGLLGGGALLGALAS